MRLIFKSILQSPILAIAIPMILSNVTIPLMGVVDTAMMGHLDSAYYLAAIGVGSVLIDFVYWGFNALRMSTTGYAAQAHGQQDNQALALVLIRGLFLALVISVLLLLCRNYICQVGLYFIQPEMDVRFHAEHYFLVRICGAPFVMMNFVLIGWLIGLERTRAVLLMVVMTNIIGMLLDVLFVYGLQMTTQGVALASVIAQGVGVSIGFWLVKAQLKSVSRPVLKAAFELKAFHAFFNVNQNIYIRTMCLVVVFTYFTYQGSRFGPIVLAANVVLMNFNMVMAFVLDGFANAAEVLVGKAVGLKQKNQYHEVKSLLIKWSAAVSIIIALLYAIFGYGCIDLMTSIPDVQKMAKAYLIWVIVLPIVGVWSYFYDGVFIGMTQAKAMRNTMIVAMIAFFLALYLALPLKNTGLWLAFMVFLAARGLYQKWRLKYIEAKLAF